VSFKSAMAGNQVVRFVNDDRVQQTAILDAISKLRYVTSPMSSRMRRPMLIDSMRMVRFKGFSFTCPFVWIT